MPRRRRSAVLCTRAVVAGLLLALTSACSGGGGGSTAQQGREQTAADNLAKQILRVGSTGGSKVTAKQAQCIADGTVADVGLDRLQKYGIITKDLTVDSGVQGVKMTPADADELAKVFVSCIDSERLVEQQFLSGSKVSAAQKKCLRDVIDESATRQILSRSFQGQRPVDVYAGVRGELRGCARLGAPK